MRCSVLLGKHALSRGRGAFGRGPCHALLGKHGQWKRWGHEAEKVMSYAAFRKHV